MYSPVKRGSMKQPWQYPTRPLGIESNELGVKFSQEYEEMRRSSEELLD